MFGDQPGVLSRVRLTRSAVAELWDDPAMEDGLTDHAGIPLACRARRKRTPDD